MPGVCRVGDKEMMECKEIPRRRQGSNNVFVNGIKVSCQGHTNTPHLGLPHLYTPAGTPLHPNCTFHPGDEIAVGSRTVFVNGKGIGRIGDKIRTSAGPNTSVAEGSPNVLAGG